MSLLALPHQTLTLQRFSDDMNRADNSTSLGPNYRSEVNGAQILGNKATTKQLVGAVVARTGTWQTVVSSASHNGARVGTDNWTIQAQLAANTGVIGNATDNLTGIGCNMTDASPGSGSTLVYFVSGTATSTSNVGCQSGIVTWALTGAMSGVSTATQLTGQTIRSPIAVNCSTSSLLTFTRRMYTATRSVFSAMIGGTVIGQWDDSTGIVPAGNVYNRRWFLVLEGNQPIFPGTYGSPAIDSITVFDNQY